MSIFTTVGICFVPLLVLVIILLICCREMSAFSAVFAILIGLFAIIPVTLLQTWIANFPFFEQKSIESLFLTNFGINGLIEELIKFLFLLLLPGKKKKTLVFILLSCIVGFSFGTFETVVYLIRGITSVPIRMVTSVLLHTFCTGLSGLTIWSIKDKKRIISPFVSAILLHGLYNMFVSLSGVFLWFSYITIIYTIIRLRFSYTRLTSIKKDDNIHEQHDAG